ncbi:RHS repeat-associated core domain-containing protein [Anaerotruncus massiliensis (ex Togo et al. 2019)]|uniref:RHS repeat-associated core domain-containing protein n=1 Tax=Anaerotruncus massiliensis (ex Togo et al. 2019) TaxID=1673720 RepID=UPI0027B91711|nr:RHS repeat-associated core domain-containing protein [Anaerotruncus massiliensis (ex Togo et al. 2019)]
MTTYEDNGSLNMELTEETGAQEAAVPMAVAASDRAEYIDAIPREYVEAPYHIAYKGNETVSLNSGALQLSYTDVHLPGLNGFDLDVVRSYDSTASGAQYAIPEKTSGSWYGQDVRQYTELRMRYMYFKSTSAVDEQRESNDFSKDDYYIENLKGKRLKTIARANDHFLKLYGLGNGWRFNFPSIEYSAPTEIMEIQEGLRGTMYLHLDDGRSITIARNYDKDVWEFEDYEEKDITFSYSASQTVVTHRNGRKDVFSGTEEDIRLQYMEDKFGNRISFGYTGGRLSRITDTMGRVLNLKETVSGNAKTFYWQQEDTGDILCKYTVQDNRLMDARAVIREGSERVTAYEYTPKIGNTRLFLKSSQSADDGVDITYQLLTAIRHPSGARTEYTYQGISRDLPSCMHGTVYSFAVQARRDFPDPADRNAAIHEETYSFAVGELDLTDKQVKKVGRNGFGADYTKTATVEYLKGGVAEKRVVSSFESKHGMLSTEETYHIISGAARLVGRREIRYEFENRGKRKLPVSETDTVYDPQGGGARSKTMTWAYDSKDNVTAYTENYPQDAANNQNVSSTYDLSYSLMTGRVTTNTSGTIREAYTLTSDKKLAAEKRVYDGDVLKERAAYEYDGQNRLIREKRYYGDPLDTTEDCAVTEYVYGPYSPEPIEVRLLGVKDANGNLIAPTDTADAAGTIKQTAAFDWYGRQTSATDGNGHTSTVEYDGLSRKVKETNPDGTFRTAEYDDANNRITTADEAGNRSRLQYTPLGQIERESLLDGEMEIPVASFTYDHLERLTEQTAYGGDGTVKNRTAQVYDLYDNVISRTLTDAAGKELYKETAVYEPVVESRYSRVTKTVDGDAAAPSVVTQTTSDQLGRVVEERVKGTADSVVVHGYDKLGNKVSTIDPNGNVSRWEYDHAGRVTKETNAAGKSSLTAYDALGNKVSTTDPKGKATLFHYDAAGRLIRQEAPFEGGARAVSRYFYDAAGNVLRQEVLCGAPDEPEAWRKTEYRYDNRDRVTDTILFEADGSENRTRYEYDAAGNKVAVYTGMLGDSPDGAAKTTCEYNRFGKVVKMVDPRSNALPADDPLYLVETCVYDAVGRLVSKTDRNKNTTVYAYDALDRVLSETVTVDGVPESIAHGYTKTNQKLSDSNGTLAVTYRYDARGRLVEQAESDGVVKSFAYDAAGNRTSFTLTRNGTAEISLGYTYDSLNRLAEVKKGEAVIARYAYDDNGNRISLEYPESGLTTAYAYNAANLVISLVNRRGDTVVSSYRYTYYLDGNQKSKTEADGKVTDYVYDGMGRLARESEAEGNTIVYAYDRFSNRSSMTVTGGETYTTTYGYHPNNWLLTEEKREKDTVETYRYRYDGNGNQVYREWSRTGPDDGTVPRVGYVPNGFRRELATLEIRGYNGFNQMVSLYADGERTAYAYRPDGLRCGKTYGSGADATGVTHLWDGQNIVAEIGATGNVVARYLRGANLIAREQDGALQYYLHNAHGDVVQRTDALGNLLKNYRYDAFGNEENPEPLDVNPFRYCGEYFDRETGGYYLRARSYDPRTGRFTAEDSARAGFNWYAYGNGNPVAYMDLTGNAASPVELQALGQQYVEEQFNKLMQSVQNKIDSAQYAVRNAVDQVIQGGVNFTANVEQTRFQGLDRVASLLTPDKMVTNYLYNKQLTYDPLITDQESGSAAVTRMGYREGSYNGCGWVATYNALRLLDDPKEPANIILHYESTGGTVARGEMGVYPQAVESYFEDAGYDVTNAYFPKNLDEAMGDATVGILMYKYSGSMQMHYVAIGRVDGQLQAYNDSADDPFKSIDAWLKKHRRTAMSFMTIRKRERK